MSNPNSEPKFSKYELNEEQLATVTGGYTRQKQDGTAAGNVAAKWGLAQGAAA
jgi:bacteriocin-like protein